MKKGLLLFFFGILTLAISPAVLARERNIEVKGEKAVTLFALIQTLQKAHRELHSNISNVACRSYVGEVGVDSQCVMNLASGKEITIGGLRSHNIAYDFIHAVKAAAEQTCRRFRVDAISCTMGSASSSDLTCMITDFRCVR